jgi:hypothetical protein
MQMKKLKKAAVAFFVIAFVFGFWTALSLAFFAPIGYALEVGRDFAGACK